jgi:predicted Zn finger-like uncharacterized protein
MIIVCQNCQARIQLDDTKVPPLPFSIKCPKCSSIIGSNGSSPASQKSGVALGGSPSTDHRRLERHNPAPAYELKSGSNSTETASQKSTELVHALAQLLDQQKSNGKRSRDRRPNDRRQVLICAAESRRESIAQRLAENDYHVFVAEDTRQAVERMRENQLEIVLLDSDFDQAEQGAAFVTREVNVLRPAQRRRLFFGLLSPSLRTLDAHAAFLNNANITINFSDIDDIPSVLDDAVREYNELYSDFFQALSLPAL